MNKLNVGDYVRTDKGEIRKIIRETDDLYQLDKDYNLAGSIIKSSPNIIDLIEVMDLMHIDINPDDCGGIVVPRIAETKHELDRYKEKMKNKEYILKSIVTHQQFSQMEYKVGE